jgi:hypothetical protein
MQISNDKLKVKNPGPLNQTLDYPKRGIKTFNVKSD